MVIDDLLLERQALTEMLNDYQRFKAVTDCAFDDEALQRVKQLQPGVILLDLKTSFSNILKVSTQLRAASPASGIIVAFNDLNEQAITRLRRIGIKGYITENSSVGELFLAIRQVIKGKFYRTWRLKTPTPEKTLSSREREIARLISTGMTCKQIAGHLQIAYKTVEVHRYNIFRKLNIKKSVMLANFVTMGDW
jgi:DNA-binding NarL/FixJ family response regulator